MHSPSGSRRGFTLIELLVVIAIIAILVALLLPAVQAVREAARKSQCQDHLHNLGVGLHNYEGAHKQLPPGAVNRSLAFAQNWATNAASPPFERARDPDWTATWALMLLPFIEQKPLYDQYRFGDTVVSQPAVTSQAIDLLRCPSEIGNDTNFTQVGNFAKGTYGVCINVDDAFSTTDWPGVAILNEQPAYHKKTAFNMGWQYGATFADIIDGTSNTIFVAEIVTQKHAEDVRGAWGHPAGCYFSLNADKATSVAALSAANAAVVRTPNIAAALNGVKLTAGQDFPAWCGNDTLTDRLTACSDADVSPYLHDTHVTSRSYHPGGVQVALGDAKVSFISETIDKLTWVALCSTRGKEQVGAY